MSPRRLIKLTACVIFILKTDSRCKLTEKTLSGILTVQLDLGASEQDYQAERKRDERCLQNQRGHQTFTILFFIVVSCGGKETKVPSRNDNKEHVCHRKPSFSTSVVSEFLFM